MKFAVTNAEIYRDGGLNKGDLLVEDGRTVSFSAGEAGVECLDFSGCVVFPGFTDVHVHLREPGFSYKETIATGTRAAARGGYTTVCAMPNLKPVPEDAETLAVQLELIRRAAAVRVLPYGAISCGQRGEKLADLAAMAEHAAGFTDDGFGVASGELMQQAMAEAAALGKILAAHCEDMNYAPADPRSEWKLVERDLQLLRRQPCAYHVCHVSCRESVELIREAKAQGLNVSCETAPHYLLMDNSRITDHGRYKMNPPLRSEADREAMIAALLDGTIDMIATDHAPHSAEEKSRGFAGSLNGIVGLETAFPVLYTALVKSGILPLERLVELLHDAPNRRFGIESSVESGDFTVFDLNKEYSIDPAEFESMGRSLPFEGMQVFGRCKLTVCAGRIAWREED